MSSSKGRMSTESIKACSGQFDLESVYKLLMERMELRAIEALAPCTNLEVCVLTNGRGTSTSERPRNHRYCVSSEPAQHRKNRNLRYTREGIGVPDWAPS